ncbi:MAG: hypothetical protein K2X55_04390 [Burkholderiaceae bacterium]|nr:hypothetical protein [Burkholderiaceae bacterium]
MQDTTVTTNPATTKAMTHEERYKVYAAFAEISRKWVTVMDTKAGFVAALNLGLLGFLWTGAKLFSFEGLTRWITLSATALSLISLLAAIWVVLPRETLREIFGKKIRWDKSNLPVSFYGYVASEYQTNDFSKFERYVADLDHESLAQEALKQHFVICHSVAKKSRTLKTAGMFLISALVCVAIAIGHRIVANEDEAAELTISKSATWTNEQLFAPNC